MTTETLAWRISTKGYGYFLALKILKAVIAVPWFLVVVFFVQFVLLLFALKTALKGIFWEYPKAMSEGVMLYWSQPWFRNFSRAFYRKHYHKPEPIYDN